MSNRGSSRREAHAWGPVGRLWLVLVLLTQLLLSLSLPAQARDGSKILLLKSADSPVYQRVVKAFNHHLDNYCKARNPDCQAPEVQAVTLDEKAEKSIYFPYALSDVRLVITIGQKAAQFGGRFSLNKPVLHTLVPYISLKEMDHSRHLAGYSAIYLDQPMQRHMQLAQLIQPQRLKLGVLLGPTSKLMQQKLEQAASKLNVDLIYSRIDQEEALGPELKELLEKSSQLLALPDPLVHNRKNIFNILLSSYHNKVPVIGFSSAYVKAGALGAVYSSPEDVGRHIADMVGEAIYTGNNKLPPPSYPKYFSIKFNDSVARSLGITLPDPEAVKKLLSGGESQ